MEVTRGLLLALSILTHILQGQLSGNVWSNIKKPSTTDTTDLRSSFLVVGTEYTSRVASWGRTFDEKQFGIAPYIFLNSRGGIYGYVMSNYWSLTPSIPARIVSGIGYQRSLTNWFSFFAGYERWFNRYGDAYFDHALENEIDFGIDLIIKNLTIEPMFIYLFGLERISQLDISVERYCQLISKRITISVRPAAVASMATPVFAYIYYESPDPDYDYEKFEWVNFESSLSLDIEWGNLELSGSVRYNHPFNIGNEKLTPFLSFTADVSFSF
jgi:hypothetical protein